MLDCFTAARYSRSCTAIWAIAGSLTFNNPFITTQRESCVSHARYIQPRPPKAIVPLTSYFPATMSPGLSEGTNEYSCPHLGQKPESRVSLCPQFEQNRLRSGTTPETSVATGSAGGTGGSATYPPPSRRLLRPDPVRAERTLRALGCCATSLSNRWRRSCVARGSLRSCGPAEGSGHAHPSGCGARRNDGRTCPCRRRETAHTAIAVFKHAIAVLGVGAIREKRRSGGTSSHRYGASFRVIRTRYRSAKTLRRLR